MPSYGKLERRLARISGRHPRIKKWLKRMYQSVNFAIYRKPFAYWLAEGIEISFPYEDPESGNFWGYYDTSPILDGKIISHFYEPDGRTNFKVGPNIDIRINGVKHSETNAWNWQQGSRPFWVDSGSILHNVFDDGQYKCKWIHLDKGSSRLYEVPVYAFDRQHQCYLGINMKRLSLLDPAYGYFAHQKQETGLRDEEDGIFKMDLERGTGQLLLTLEELKNFQTKPGMKTARHGINHIQIDPSGKRFMFLHRWYLDNGRHFSRLFTADTDGQNLFLLSDDDMVSHCNWKNDHEIIGWMRKKELGDGYFLHLDQTRSYDQIGKDVLLEDGHPSFSTCGRYMLTDTYPDKSRMSHLILFDMTTKKPRKLGSFYNPLEFSNELRCDLHPRLSENGLVTIDTVFEGIRKQAKLDISAYL